VPLRFKIRSAHRPISAAIDFFSSLLDANIILRHTLADHTDHSPKATAFFIRVARGEVRVRTTDTVIFEAAFTMERTYRVPRAEIRDQLLAILALPGVILPGKRRYRRVFELYVGYPRLSFADSSHISVMERAGMTEIITFDQGFDNIPDITRIEP